MEIAPKSTLWWNFKNPGPDALLEGELILGEEFFTAVTTNPVPIDFRVVMALKAGVSRLRCERRRRRFLRLARRERAGQRPHRCPLSRFCQNLDQAQPLSSKSRMKS